MACRTKVFSNFIIILAVLHSIDGFTIEQVKKTANMVKDICIRKTAVDPEKVEQATNGNIPEDDNFKCFTKCLLEMLQAIRGDQYNSDGLIRMIKVLLPTDLGTRAITAIQHCNNAGDGLENICDVTYSIVVCFYKTDPEFLSLIL